MQLDWVVLRASKGAEGEDAVEISLKVSVSIRDGVRRDAKEDGIRQFNGLHTALEECL